MKILLAVAGGGAIGAVARYWLTGWVTAAVGGRYAFLGTLSVNVIGSFLLGVLAVAIWDRWPWSVEARAFLSLGFLGALTTFSTFSLDVFRLVEAGRWAESAAYIVASCGLSIGALFVGVAMARWVLS